RTDKKAITAATRSMLECAASVRIAIEPVTMPAASLSAIRSELETSETRAARAFGGAWAAGPTARVGATAAAATRARVKRRPEFSVRSFRLAQETRRARVGFVRLCCPAAA